MLTPSDSDRSRRERTKTPFEILFEEEPVFSDSEEEANFFESNFGLSAHQSKHKSPHENAFDPPLPDEFSNQILKVCCNECICCRRIRTEIVDLQLKRLRDSSSSQSNKEKVNKSTKNNPISNQPVKKPSLTNKKRSRKDLKEAIGDPQRDLIKNISPSDTHTSFNELLEQLNQGSTRAKKSRKRNSSTRPTSVDLEKNEEIWKEWVSNSNVEPQPKSNLVRHRLEFDSEENNENIKNVVVNKPSKPSKRRPKSTKAVQKPSEDSSSEQSDINTNKPRKTSRGSKSTKNQTKIPRRKKSKPLEKKQTFETPNDMTNGSNTSVVDDGKSHVTRKTVKLYSPEDWLNSKIFNESCTQ